MTENKLPIRQSPRLEGYNYAQNGAYFITICVQNRLRLFGTIEEQELYLNDAGKMVGEWWQKIPNKYPDFDIDLFVVMPNHFHGILLKWDETNTTVSTAVGWFKSITFQTYTKQVKADGWRPYKGRLWQRSFHDHIIRNENGLDILRQYVLSNPARWYKDILY